MTIAAWLDLGTPERVDDAITDMEEMRTRLGEVIIWAHRRRELHSLASDILIDKGTGVFDLMTELSTDILDANEAKAHLPDYDATADEIARYARERG